MYTMPSIVQKICHQNGIAPYGTDLWGKPCPFSQVKPIAPASYMPLIGRKMGIVASQGLNIHFGFVLFSVVSSHDIFTNTLLGHLTSTRAIV